MDRLRIPGILFAIAILLLGWSAIRARDGRHPSIKKGFIEPILTIPRTPIGGTLQEVLARTGDRVEPGQVLVRFEEQEMESRLIHLRQAAKVAEAAVESGSAMGRIPSQVREYLYETHPNTASAEREYVEALAAFEKAPTADRAAAEARLRRAALERTRVRKHLGELFSGGASDADSLAYLKEIERSIAEVEKLRQDAEVRSPSRATVDLLDVHAGEKLQPGQPIAILVSTGEYSVDLAVTKVDLTQLPIGVMLKGWMESSRKPIEARVESISMHKIPVIARVRLTEAEEPFVHARIQSRVPLRAGSVVSFELP
jgi:multidrug resistance efflux pump